MIATAAWADVRLPKVIGSQMVLQREMAVPIWGWADPGEKVTVTLGDCKVETTACEKGKWSVKLAAMKAGGPHTITVAGKNTITLEDVLVGEVWVCSGQSNMQWSVQASDNAAEEIAAAKYPKMRLFNGRPKGGRKTAGRLRWELGCLHT